MRNSELCVPGYRRTRLQLHVEVRVQPEGNLRNAGARGEWDPAESRNGQGHHRLRPKVGPNHPDRIRVEEIARVLRNSDDRDGNCGHGSRGSEVGRENWLPRSTEALLADDHAQ